MYLRYTLVCLVALLAGLYLQLFGFGPPVRPSQDPSTIEGLLWPNQKVLQDFEMVSHEGEPFTREDFLGRWSLVFFGYTHCPDICPVTLNTMRQARDQLAESHGDLAARVNYQFVSVDGERDTPEHLKKYLAFFGEQFNGATGSREQVDSLTGQMSVPYAIDEHEPGEHYLVAHSGSVFLISPEGTLASIYQPPHFPDAINRRLVEIAGFMESES